ncbi:hypothetical protein M8C21_022840, partial [Ambrosia artemisiifolia]
NKTNPTQRLGIKKLGIDTIDLACRITKQKLYQYEGPCFFKGYRGYSLTEVVLATITRASKEIKLEKTSLEYLLRYLCGVATNKEYHMQIGYYDH